MNLTTLTAIAANFAGDKDQSRYSGLYTQALNLGQQQFALDSKRLWKDNAAITVLSGTSAYSLPSDFMWEKDGEVTFNGIPLNPISRAEILRIKSSTDWTLDHGTPTYYIIDPEEARKQITLYPQPTANDAGKTLGLRYFPFPTDMSLGTDTPLNGYALMAQFHVSIAAWAAWYLLQAEQVTDAITAKKKQLETIYNDGVSLCVDTFKNTVSQPLQMRGGRVY